MTLFGELKRRRVFRSIAAYGVFAFALLQIIEPIMHGLHLPDATLTFAVLGLAMGFPVVVLVSWAYDLTLSGLERTQPSPRTSSHPRGLRLTLRLVGIGLLAGAPGVIVYYATRPPPSARSSTAPPSIAVLPFSDLSATRDQEYFSEGLAEEILDALAQVDGLRVAGRTSSFSFKGKGEDAQTIARKLGVTTLLEGSVRKEGSRLRVTVLLLNASDGFQLWAQTFDRQLTGIFLVQEEISEAVVRALQVKLLPGKAAVARVRKTTPEAHRQYLIARQLLNRGSGDAFRRAEEAFAKATALDPGYAPAWAGLALAAYYAANLAPSTAEGAAETRRSLDAADKALEVGADLAEAWAVRGWLRGLAEWDWEGADSDLKRAIELAGGDALVWRRYGFLQAMLGRLPAALSATRKSAELDPLAAEVWDNLGYLATAAGDLEAARAASNRALEIAPEQTYAENHLGVADLLEGRPARALARFQKSSEEIFRLQGVAMAQHDLGHAAESRRALEALAAKYAHNSAFQIAQAYAWRGEADRAFEWLEKGYRQRDGGLSFLKCDPLLRKLRKDPRYAQLLRKMKLPPT